MNALRELSNDELLKSLMKLNSSEVETVAQVFLHLNEVGRRRLYAVLGYPSLFAYCVGRLKYCDGSAARRVTASRCIEKYPALLELFREKQVTLTTIVMISKILSNENQAEVLAAVVNKPKVEVERYVARFLPGKNVREEIRILACAPKTAVVEVADGPPTAIPLTVDAVPRTVASSNEAPARRITEPGREVRQPTEQYLVKLKASESAVKKLRRIQELRGKKEPLGELFELLLDNYLKRYSPEERSLRRKLRLEDTNNKPAAKTGLARTASRYIPLPTRDLIHGEFNNQCAYLSPDRIRCECRAGLQVDHVYPFAAGGGNGAENLRLLCKAHNRLAAEEFWGTEKIARFAAGQ